MCVSYCCCGGKTIATVSTGNDKTRWVLGEGVKVLRFVKVNTGPVLLGRLSNLLRTPIAERTKGGARNSSRKHERNVKRERDVVERT